VANQRLVSPVSAPKILDAPQGPRLGTGYPRNGISPEPRDRLPHMPNTPMPSCVSNGSRTWRSATYIGGLGGRNSVRITIGMIVKGVDSCGCSAAGPSNSLTHALLTFIYMPSNRSSLAHVGKAVGGIADGVFRAGNHCRLPNCSDASLCTLGYIDRIRLRVLRAFRPWLARIAAAADTVSRFSSRFESVSYFPSRTHRRRSKAGTSLVAVRKHVAPTRWRC
jgi:hypothetical protein